MTLKTQSGSSKTRPAITGRGIEPDRKENAQQSSLADQFISGIELAPTHRESRLTLGGFAYIGVSMFLAIGAINSQNNLLFWLFGFAISIIIVSGLLSGSALMKIRVRAHTISDAYAGEELKIRYTILNQSRLFPLIASTIHEIDVRCNRLEQLDEQWTRLSAPVLHVGANKRKHVYSMLAPTSRGRYSMSKFMLSSRFPFGLLNKSLCFEFDREFVVLPHRLDLQPDLISCSSSIGQELKRSMNASSMGEEYWGLRGYRPGDSKRQIAWKHSARSGSLMVIERASLVSSKVWIWIDHQPGSSGSSSNQMIERSIALCSSLIEHATSNTSFSIGLWIPKFGIQIQPGSGKQHLRRCYKILACTDVNETGLLGRETPPPRDSHAQIVLLTSKRAYESGSSQNGALSAQPIFVDQPETWLADPLSLPIELSDMYSGKRIINEQNGGNDE